MKVLVCSGKSCTERWSKYVTTRLLWDVARLGYKNVELENCLCQANCNQGPTVIFDGTMLSYMNPVKSSEELARRIQEARKSLQKNTWK